jgi:hypothetical protein
LRGIELAPGRFLADNVGGLIADVGDVGGLAGAGGSADQAVAADGEAKAFRVDAFCPTADCREHELIGCRVEEKHGGPAATEGLRYFADDLLKQAVQIQS